MELLDQEVVGIDNLRLVAEKLYGQPDKLPDDLGPHDVGELVKHSIHRGMYREINDEDMN